jgi:glycosyltransferase involved in cell wall biosynthesis
MFDTAYRHRITIGKTGQQMNIAINARVLTERPGGPHRYTKNIIESLAGADRKNHYFIVINKPLTFTLKLAPNFTIVTLPSKNRVIFEYILYPLFSWKNRIDIHLFPKNTFSPMVRGKKIPVYHDIIYYEKNLGFREFKFFDHLHHTVMIWLCSKFSDIDLTVSDFTAERMMTLLKIKKEKIRVIKEGVEPIFRKISSKKELDAVRKKFNLSEPFFFYSGSLSPRKNMYRVLLAFDSIKDTIKHNIYFTGSFSWNDMKIFEKISAANLSKRVIRLGYLTDDELVALYNLSDGYIYASLYEGFGLPILEAQSCQTPIIVGNRSSCPEIAADSAILVDPYDVHAIADAMMKLAKDKTLREKKVKLGLKNIKKYSWDRAALELVDLFNEFRTDSTPVKAAKKAPTRTARTGK